MIPTTNPSRTRRTPLFLAAGAVALAVLTGCGAAEDAVQGAKDAAVDRASQAAQDAAGQASAKVSEAAVKAVRDQICTLVKDGSLSGADTQALDTLVATGEAAGVPNEILTLARSVAGAGADAGKDQIAELETKACAAS